MKHTPTPWEIYRGDEGLLNGIESNACSIAVFGKELFDNYGIQGNNVAEAEANTAFIVEAVNNHYKQKEINSQLLEALKDLMRDIGSGKKFCGHDFTCTCAWDKSSLAVSAAEEQNNEL